MFSINSRNEPSLLRLHLGSQKYFRKYFYFSYLDLPLPHTLCTPACILCILSCPLALFVHVQMHSEGRWSLMCQTPISVATSIHSMYVHKQFVLLVFSTHSNSAHVLTHSAHVSPLHSGSIHVRALAQGSILDH